MRPLLNPNGSKAWQESDGYIHDCANCGRKDVDALLWDEDSSCGYCGDYFCGIEMAFVAKQFLVENGQRVVHCMVRMFATIAFTKQ